MSTTTYSKIIVLVVLVVLTVAVSVNTTYATTVEHSTPNQQQREGTTIDAIHCNMPRELYLRNSETPVCMYVNTYNILVERGMDLVLHESYFRTIYILDESEVQNAQRAVEETIRMYDLDKDGAFSNINNLSANVIPHYPFVLDPTTGLIVAHGNNPNRTDSESLILGNYADTSSDVILAELQKGNSIWVDYIFLDPVTNEDGLKRSWLVQHDGYIFGAGYYYSIEEKIYRIIDDAIALYESSGFDAITALHEKINAHYPYVIDPTTNISMAHAGFPEIVGLDLIATNEHGENIAMKKLGITRIADPKSDILNVPFTELAKALETKKVSKYITFTNPTTGMVDQKRLLYKLHDGYIFGSGYYYPAADKAINVVEQTIEKYKIDKESAFADVVAQTEDLTPHYPFIIDSSNKTIVAHGAFPEVIGNMSNIFTENFTDKSPDMIIEELQDGGIWVEYSYRIPGTNFDEKKHTYLQLYDGYVFGAGYYLSQFTVIPP